MFHRNKFDWIRQTIVALAVALFSILATDELDGQIIISDQSNPQQEHIDTPPPMVLPDTTSQLSDTSLAPSAPPAPQLYSPETSPRTIQESYSDGMIEYQPPNYPSQNYQTHEGYSNHQNGFAPNDFTDQGVGRPPHDFQSSTHSFQEFGYASGVQDFQNGPDEFGLGNILRLSTDFSTEMLDFQNRQTDKQLLLLEHGQRNGNCGPQLVFGAQLRASFLAATTSGNSQFPYLGRFPTDFEGNSATDARLLHGNLSFAGHFSPWVHGYFETLFSDVFSFSSFEQGSFQVRQAYITVGNFDVSPWYMFIGKKTVGFGDMGTLSPFSQAMNWHYFAPLHEGIGAGYYSNGINVNATALNGGRGIRVSDSESIGRLNNFAANASIEKQIGERTSVLLGCGYLHGTIYDSNVAEHILPTITGDRNAAWDAHAQVSFGRFRVAGEYTQTFDPWPVTDHEVVVYRTEAAVDMFMMGKPSTFSVSWSEGTQGSNGSQFEYNRQLVVGSRIRFSPNTMFTAEWVQSTGFAPLINITRASNLDVRQNSAVLGLVITL